MGYSIKLLQFIRAGFLFAEITININSMIYFLVGDTPTNTFSVRYSSLCYDVAPFFFTYLPEFRRNLLPSLQGGGVIPIYKHKDMDGILVSCCSLTSRRPNTPRGLGAE
jgi:hypothetical protein